jgi:hypothetical protein
MFSHHWFFFCLLNFWLSPQSYKWNYNTKLFFFFSFFFFSLVVLEFEFTTWATLLVLFALVVLWIGSHLLGPALIAIIFYNSLHCWDHRLLHCPAQLLAEMGVSSTFWLGWPWATILLISASPVARMTGVRHWCPTDAFCVCVSLTSFT